MDPQRHPYPKVLTSHKVILLDAITELLQGTSKEYVDDLFALVSGALVYQGTWDASTNTPTLADGTGTKGHYYAVNVGGTQDLGSGNITFTAGDRVVHNGTIWQKWDTNDVITSVFGRTGDVVAVSGDYAHSEIGSVTADQHHLEDTQARQQNIYYWSYARGSDSAPNDGSKYKPFKTADKAIQVGGDRSIIITDDTLGLFQAETITIPAGLTINLRSYGAGYILPNSSLTSIKLNQGSQVNISNMELLDIAQLGGVTDAGARLKNCNLGDATTSTSINFELIGTRLGSAALIKMATAKSAIGFATDASGVHLIFGNGTQGIDMQDTTLDKLCDPTSDQEAVNRRYMVAEYLTGGRQWWSVTEQKNTPEATPAIFEAFLVGAAPTGVWAGHANEIAIAEEITPSTDWVYITVQAIVGLVYNQNDGKFYEWGGAAWAEVDWSSNVPTHVADADAHHSEVHGISDNTKHTGALVNDNITLGDANGLVKDSGVAISSVVGGLIYQGTWDASTNTPTLADGTGTKGYYYRVSVGGSQDLGSGSITFAAEDFVAHNGSIWQKIDHTDQVTSVFTRQGAIVALASDYDASQIDNDSGVAGAFVDDALDQLDSEIPVQATEAIVGIAELATQGETDTGTDNTRIVTPLKLTNFVRTRRYLVSTRVRVGTGAGAAADGQIQDVPAILFNATQDQVAVMANHIDPGIDLSAVNPILEFHFIAGSTVPGVGTETIRMQLDIRYRADGQGFDGAYDETLLVDIDLALGTAYIHFHNDFALDKAKMAAGDGFSVKITRFGAHGNDDYPDDIGLENVWLVYEGKGGD